ncbi:exopolysaccharide transport family protein [Paraflavitalea pollutisoli]|uniref:exopolysaccharide transport family protein n=1 Tax=Paraflavitalea pollutisoli TaxID=3034143 RepID=UPI0023EA7DCD|nr:Wzz/FepE/Etk N-terminal domain-containing protein [Paraflavitalea sp. H1-2-19X]
MDLLYLLYSLLRKKWIIIGCTVLGVVAGFVFTLFLPKTYGSVAQYSTGFTMEQKVTIKEGAGINFYEIETRFNNVIETFKSPKVMGMLSYKLLLHDLEDMKPFHNLTEEQKNSATYKAFDREQAKIILRRKIANMELLSPADPEEKKIFDLVYLYGYAPEYLQAKLLISRADRTDYLNILCRSENPEMSAFIANTIGQQFIRFFNSIYGLRNQESAAKLDSLAASKKRTVDSLTAGLKLFRERIGTPDVGARASAAMSVVQSVTSNYQQELAKLNNLRGEFRSVEEQLQELGTQNTSGGFVNNNAAILALGKENEGLELQKNGKSEEEIKKLQDQIEANVRKIGQLKGSGSSNADRQSRVNRVQVRQEELLARKMDLQQQILASETNAKLFGAQKAEYDAITMTGGGDQVLLDAQERDLRIANTEYETMKRSLQSTLDLDVNPQNNFKQILIAVPAFAPEPSKRSLVLGLCGMLMLFLSAFIVIALEFFDSSYKTPTIFQRQTKLKLLTALNRLNLKKKTIQEYFKNDGDDDRAGEGAVFIENLRKLRFELINSGKKVFLVTSTKPQEGKTTVIEALANSLSLTKKKVLLIDANFSNNTLTRKFEAKPALDQFSYSGNGNVVDKFLASTSMTTIPNTDLIGCTEGNHTPSEVLPKNNLMDHLPKIAEGYDFVFIEGASLNKHADSKELAGWVDGIIAVFSAKSSLGQIDKDSIQYLNNTGDKFVGVVLNNVEANNMDL